MATQHDRCPQCGLELRPPGEACSACGWDGAGDDVRDRITQALLKPGEEDHPDIGPAVAGLRSGPPADDPIPAEPDEPEPQLIVFSNPVVLDGPPAQSGRSWSSRQRMASCYLNRSCPTCAPCCFVLALLPILFMVWTIYPQWQKARELRNVTVPGTDQQSTPDPASDQLKAQVKAQEFASRSEVEGFIREHGIVFVIREDGYWIANDRTQQEALVILQQRWQALPLEAMPEAGAAGE